MLAIMSTEGVEAAMSLEADMFPDAMAARPGRWRPTASTVSDRMISLFEEAFPLDLMSEDGGGAGHRLLHGRAGIGIAAAEVAGRRGVPGAGGGGAGQ
jgi:hypothetical protein